MRGHLVRTALLAEVTAILLSQHPTPQATALWLVAAGIVYWLIARGVRIAHALQLVVAAGGVVVAAVAGGWSALAYAVEVTALVTLWRREGRAGESGS